MRCPGLHFVQSKNLNQGSANLQRFLSWNFNNSKKWPPYMSTVCFVNFHDILPCIVWFCIVLYFMVPSCIDTARVILSDWHDTGRTAENMRYRCYWCYCINRIFSGQCHCFHLLPVGTDAGLLIQDLGFGTFLKKAPQRQNLGLCD